MVKPRVPMANGEDVRPDAQEGGTIDVVPTDRIDVDPDAGARGPVDEGGKSFAEFVESVRERPGIEVPIVVRPITRDRFSVVYGYRRLAAVRLLARTARDDIDRKFYSAIPAIVRPYDDRAACLANLAENVARENLPPYRIAQRAILLHERYGDTYASIARTAGVSHGYLKTLVELEKRLCPRLLRRFHNEHTDDNSATMTQLVELARFDHDEQIARFEGMLAERRALQRLAASQLVRFGDAPVDPADLPRDPRAKPIPTRKIQGALLSMRGLEAFSFGEQIFAPTDRERQVARALLRWILGLDKRPPFVIKVPKDKKAEVA